jgi:hypothetical protein
MKPLVLFVMMTFSLVVSGLADVTGRWTGSVGGQFDVTYDFKQEGEKLTGTTVGPDGSKMDITEGTIKGEDVKFTINVNGAPLVITGKVKDTVMNLSFTFDGNPGTLDLKKENK